MLWSVKTLCFFDSLSKFDTMFILECFLFQLSTSHSSQGRSVEHLMEAFKSIETSCPGFSDGFVEKIIDSVKRSKR